MITVDSHTHSQFSPDGHNSIDEMCRAAISAGITHLSLTEHTDGDYCHPLTGFFDYDSYSDAIDVARRRYPELTLLKGIEFGEPHTVPNIFAEASNFEVDVIIGSLHRPENFSMGDPVRDHDLGTEQLFREYFGELKSMVEFGGFDILGHPDLPVRYYFTGYSVSSELEGVMRACVSQEIIPEINTSTVRRGYPKLMPGDEALGIYCDCGGKYISCGSDAHHGEDIGADYELLEESVKRYSLIPVYFKGRSLREMPSTVFNT